MMFTTCPRCAGAAGHSVALCLKVLQERTEKAEAAFAEERLQREASAQTAGELLEELTAERDAALARVEVLEGLLKRALPYIKNVAHSDQGGYSEDNPWLWEEMKLALGFEVSNWAKDQIAALAPATESAEEPSEG